MSKGPLVEMHPARNSLEYGLQARSALVSQKNPAKAATPKPGALTSLTRVNPHPDQIN
jgi:hypothetical protein